MEERILNVHQPVDLVQELQNNPNLDNIFATNVSNLLSKLICEDADQAATNKELSIAFANWWNHPTTQKDDRIKVLKDAAFNPFGKDNTETIDQNMKNKLNAMMAIMQPALRDDLQRFRYSAPDHIICRKLDRLLIQTQKLMDNNRKPVHKDICQARHLGYSLMLVQLAILEPNVDNANNITDYANKISGKGTNVEFNRNLGRTLMGIGAAIAVVVFFASLFTTMAIFPLSLAATVTLITILGGSALAGVTGVTGWYLYDKSLKTGLAHLTDRVGSSIYRDVKRQNARPNLGRRNGNGYHLLGNDGDNADGLNLRDRAVRVLRRG